MAKYNKTICTILICLIFTIFPMPYIEHPKAAEVQRHRFVVLVYDDSGSMSDNHSASWEKANYSLQSLAALLDSDDKLYVVRMSESQTTVEIPLQSSARQQAINLIRNTPHAGGDTPLDSIRTAGNLLEQTSDEYDRWLIISSDGQFQLADKKACTGDEFAQVLNDFRGRNNNSSINMLFLAIGDQVSDELKSVWRRSTGQAPLEASNASGIIARMNEISALITSRDPDHPGESNLPIQIQDSNTVLLQSPFPLRRITVLRQAGTDSPLELQSFQINGNSALSTLKISGPYSIGSPPGGREAVAGRLLHINMGTATIPEGTYKLVFNQDIASDRGNIIFVAETAIDFTCGLYKTNDQQVKVDSANAVIGESVQARVQILRSSGSQAMNIQDVADQVEVEMDIGQQNAIRLKPDPASNSFVASGIKLEKGKLDARFTLTMRGWYKGIKHVLLDVNQNPPRNLGLKVEPGEWRAALDSIDSGPEIQVIPTVDGRPMTVSEFAEIRDNLKIQNSRLCIDIKAGTTSFILRPRSSIWKAPFISAGNQNITAELKGRIAGENANAIIQIYIEDIPWYKKYGPALAWPLLTLLLLWYIYGLYRKPRFKRGSIVDWIPDTRNDDWDDMDSQGQKLENGWFKRYLIPFQAERTEIGSATFIATQSSAQIKVSAESLTRIMGQDETRIRLAGTGLRKEELTGDMIISSGQEMLIQRPYSREWFKYSP